VSIIVALLILWAIVNVALSVMNVRNAKRNVANSRRNLDVALALDPMALDHDAVMRAIRKHSRGGAA
jgi:hypothetical protein